MIEKKKNGVFAEILLKILKFLPLMVLVACACGMIAFVLCSHFLDKEYVSNGSFRALTGNSSSANNQAASLINNNYDFYARVAGHYNLESENKLSAANIKNSLFISANDDEVKIIVSDSDPVVAFDILTSVHESLAEHFELFGSKFEISDIYWDTQPSTHFSMNKIYFYIVIAAVIGFTVVLIIAIAKGAVRGKISSAKEFKRNYKSDICVVMPFVANPVGFNDGNGPINTEENDD